MLRNIHCQHSKMLLDKHFIYFCRSTNLLHLSQECAFDKDGRVILPKKLINHAEIDKNVMFVGLGPTFQLWNPESYEKKKINMIKNAQEKKINPRLRPIPKGT